MGATASNPAQEIRSLLAYSEIYEKKGDMKNALKVLQNATRHYWREPLGVSGLEIGDRKELLETASLGLANLWGNIPEVYKGITAEMLDGEKGGINDYFMSVADVAEEHLLETRVVVTRRLMELLARGGAELRRWYNQEAESELKGYEGIEVMDRLLWCWPESEAGRAKAGEIGRQAESLKGAERQSALWKLEDVVETCALGDKKAPSKEGPETEAAGTLDNGEGLKVIDAVNGEPEIVRLTLPQKGDVAGKERLLFAGGRKKSAYGNRFTVMCYDMEADKRLWDTREILLHGKTVGEEGYETGFEEVFLCGDLAMVHGRYDVIAFDWHDGKDMSDNGKKEKKWHFIAPMGFEIQKVGLWNQILVLCGRGSTVALWAPTGEILWDGAEAGEFYGGPYFDGQMMLTVRKSPSEISFRQIKSGRLLSRLKLPELTTNRKHPLFDVEGGGANPAAAEAMEGYPISFAEGALAVVDGLRYHVVDVRDRQLRWSCAATKLDTSREAGYRLWINGGRMFVLKPYYAVLENCVFDTKSGSMLWRRREGGKKAEEKLKNVVAEGSEGEQTKGSTGLIMGSMTFIGGKVYGIRYEMATSSVVFVGMDPASGNEIMRVEEKNYTAPEAYVEPSRSKDCAVVRIQDGNKFEIWQVDVTAKKVVQKLKMEGFGRFGEYGEASAVWQGPYLALWTYEKRLLTSSKGK
jgi:hypothetical protein